MSLALSPEVEAAVLDHAQQEGLSANDLLARTFPTREPNGNRQTSPEAKVQALLAEWQARDRTPIVCPMESLPGETPTQALFRKWDEEDANMTDGERGAQDRLWDEIERGLCQNRFDLGIGTSRMIII